MFYEFINANLRETVKAVDRRTQPAATLRYITDFVVSQSALLQQNSVENAEQILAIIPRTVESLSEEVDAAKLVEILSGIDKLAGLLGPSSSQKTLTAIRATMEPILEEFLREKRSNTKKIREKRDFFAAERRRLERVEEETVRDLKKEERTIDKDTTTKIIRGIREAEDMLINGYIQGEYEELSIAR